MNTPKYTEIVVLYNENDKNLQQAIVSSLPGLIAIPLKFFIKVLS